MDTVSSPNYPPNVVNAEPPSTATAAAGAKAAADALNRASPALEGGARWSIMRTAPRDYLDSLDALVQDVQFAKSNPRLTPEARMNDARKAAAAWRTDAESIVAGLETRVTEWTRELEARTRPPVPIPDRAALEAALANARSDVLLVVSNAADEELANRLGELARGDDEVVRYLVLGDWPATLFRARDAKSAPLMWQQERRRVLAAVLDERGVQALARLDAMQHAKRAALALRGGHALLLVNNPAYFPQGDGER